MVILVSTGLGKTAREPGPALSTMPPRRPQFEAQRMGRFQKDKRLNQSGGLIFTLVFAAILGGAGGDLIAKSIWGVEARLPGAAIGALVMMIAEGLIATRRKRGEPRTTGQRLLPDFFFGGILGWLVGLVFPEAGLATLGLLLGLVSGLLGMGISKLILGSVAGLVLGLTSQFLLPELPPALLGALVLTASRILRSIFIREEAPVRLVGERIPKERARYVVPFEAHSKYVGVDYMHDLARAADGSFKRNPPGIGLIDDFEVLRSPHFDPAKVDPLIREFYEHTSNYKLSIVPKWDLRYKPLFWAFKRYLAQPIGQANLPFNMEETQQGVVSYIDTIDFDYDGIVDLRGWIRAYRDSHEAIYVGIYTTIRYEDVGYVSVGFPLPAANFTATLLPYNQNGSDFLLKTHGTSMEFPGHYLTAIDKETGALTVMKLPTFGEEIEVSVANGQLRTEHRFYLAGLKFLSLHYTID